MSTTIAWTDETWNPVTGCTKVSAGCDHCYAETLAERFRGTPGHYFEQGFDVQLRPAKLAEPMRWRKPRRVFVNSMSDLFHEAVPDEYIAQVFGVMAANYEWDRPSHVFQVLTKRHARMRALLSSVPFRFDVALAAAQRTDEDHADAVHDAIAYHHWPLPNVWLGVSVENQRWADIRIPTLMETPAAVRFLSCEPLLGPVFLNRLHAHCPTHDHDGGFCSGGCADLQLADWVIAGGESGRGARPMDAEWATDLRDQCAELSIPFFMKQAGTVLAKEWGAHGKGEDPTEWPEPFPQEYPRGAA